jgi:hypothetical protein
MRYENLVTLGRLEEDILLSMAEKSYIADDVYTLLSNAYANVKGGLHFASPDELLSKTSLWKVIYLDSHIVGAIIYKSKRGLKMVAMAICDSINYTLRTHIKTMLSHIFQKSFRNSWMEVSECAEKFILHVGGDKFLVKNTLASQLTAKNILSLDNNGTHYYRKINGVIKRKVMIGTFK